MSARKRGWQLAVVLYTKFCRLSWEFLHHLGHMQCLALLPFPEAVEIPEVVNNGQENKFHQSGILQVNTVVLAAGLGDPGQPRAERAFGISASEQDSSFFGAKSNQFMKI